MIVRTPTHFPFSPALAGQRKVVLGLLCLMLVACKKEPRPALNIEWASGSSWLGEVPSAIAEYICVPGYGTELRIYGASYGLSCDEAKIPPEKEWLIGINLRLPLGVDLAEFHKWSKFPEIEEDVVTRGGYWLTVRRGKVLYEFPSLGHLEILKWQARPGGFIEVQIKGEANTLGANAPRRVVGRIAAKLCRYEPSEECESLESKEAKLDPKKSKKK